MLCLTFCIKKVEEVLKDFPKTFFKVVSIHVVFKKTSSLQFRLRKVKF